MIKSEGELSVWLGDMADQPLPGGVSAAALAAAMGAALCAKAARVTLRRREVNDTDRIALEVVVDRASEDRSALIRLVEADQQAYQAVLDIGDPLTSGQIWQAATEVPVKVAETSQSLLADRALLEGVCWSSARVDLDVGLRLLEVGLHAGLRAAEANLGWWGDADEAADLRLRTERLRQQSVEEDVLD
ncbi:MAG: cyclodeaminase/cyclohydrolase family protein [Anaerolineae bacterium]|jgi:formiminotetrahydrofolate cyclodeaminase